MVNKKTAFLILGLAGVLILIVILVAQNINKEGVGPLPIPVFTKPSSSPTSLPIPKDEELLRQTEADINVNQLQNQVLQNYPWYNQLPLQEKNYFVFFDLEKKSFEATIYPQNSSPTPIDDQVRSYQQEILGKLQQLGINTNQYQIEWVITPE